MIILCDTREQRILSFPADPALTSVREETLPYGDYMVEYSDGTRPPVAWERKGLSDLYGTLTQGYDRFKAEILGAKEAGLTLILLIEGSLTQVQRGLPHRSTSGDQILQQLFTLQIRYRLPVIFCQSSSEAALWLLEYAKAIGRVYAAGRKAKGEVEEVFGKTDWVEAD